MFQRTQRSFLLLYADFDKDVFGYDVVTDISKYIFLDSFACKWNKTNSRDKPFHQYLEHERSSLLFKLGL